MKARSVIKKISGMYPEYRQYSWDNSGVQVVLDIEVSTIALALDPTVEALQQAEALGAQLLLTHHPLFFTPSKQLQYDSITGSVAIGCVERGISLYAMHTSYDNHPRGMGFHFLEAMDFSLFKPLKEVGSTTLYKVVVFCPPDSTSLLQQALYDAGAGALGNYSECSFTLTGEGSFLAGEGAIPALGAVGCVEKVQENRIEMVFPRTAKGRIVQAIQKAHPYETPAYDIYQLQNKVEPWGCGVIGIAKEGAGGKGVSQQFFLDSLQTFFGAAPEKIYGSLADTIHKIGYVGGAGSGFIKDAARAHCDVYITGEVRYHDLEHVRGTKTAVIQMGHGISERPAFYGAAQDISQATDCKVVICEDCFEVY